MRKTILSVAALLIFVHVDAQRTLFTDILTVTQKFALAGKEVAYISTDTLLATPTDAQLVTAKAVRDFAWKVGGRAVSSASPSTGEVLKWNGTAWAPAADGGGGADGNGLYSGSDTVPDGTTATLLGSLTFADPDGVANLDVLIGTLGGIWISAKQDSAIIRHFDVAGNNEIVVGETGLSVRTPGTGDRLTIYSRDARYGGDYSGSYSDRSLVDKEYVDGQVAGAVSIPEGEIPFGNATSDGIESSPDFTFYEGDNLYLVDAGIEAGSAIAIKAAANAFFEAKDEGSSSTTGGGALLLRSADGAANADGDRLGYVQFMGATGVGGTAAGAIIEAFAAGAWGSGDAPGRIVLSTTPDGTVTAANVFELAMTGAARLHNYGDGTFTGTATKTLQVDVDGNIIEGSVLAGGIALGAANQIFGMNAAGTANEYKTFSGTANQVTITDGAGAKTWSLPQDIHTAATPTFSDLTLTDDLTVNDDITMSGGGIQSFTMSGGTLNTFNMNGLATATIGDALSNPQLYVNGISGYFAVEPTTTTNDIDIRKFSASGSAPENGQNLFLSINDGAALPNGHYLGSVLFKSRGSASGLETGAQISAIADGGDWTSSSNPTQLLFSVVPNGTDVLNNAMALRQNRQMELHAYGAGTFTGTPTYSAAYTSGGLLIERPFGADELNAPPTIRPAQLTAKTDNWNPTGYSTTKTQTIELSGDASFRFITGMEAATRDGVMKIIENSGAVNCVGIAKQHTDSDAENRFFHEVVLYPGMAATFRYDSVGARWKLMGTNIVTYGNTTEYNHRAIAGNSGDDFFIDQQAAGGSFNKTSSSSASFPVVRERMLTGSVATSYPSLINFAAPIYLTQNKSYLRVYAKVGFPVLPTAAEDFDFRFGVRTAALDTLYAEGAYFSLERQENSGGFTIKTNDGATTTTTNAGAPVTASTYYNLELIYYPYGEVVGFVNGVRYATTSTIPEAIGAMFYLQIDKDNGTTSRELEYLALEAQFTWVSD